MGHYLYLFPRTSVEEHISIGDIKLQPIKSLLIDLKTSNRRADEHKCRCEHDSISADEHKCIFEHKSMRAGKHKRRFEHKSIIADEHKCINDMNLHSAS